MQIKIALGITSDIDTAIIEFIQDNTVAKFDRLQCDFKNLLALQIMSTEITLCA